jgi:adenylate kinase
MLRAAVDAGSDLGKEAQIYMSQGLLLPDETMISIILARLDQDDCRTRGWLLDGFPRTGAQAEALAKAGVSCDVFIHLDVPDDILVERVVGRRSDPVTGKIYHMKYTPPETDEIRDRLVQRSDDTDEKIGVRIRAFHDNLSAVLGNYCDVTHKFDGNRSPKLIWNDIKASLLETSKKANINRENVVKDVQEESKPTKALEKLCISSPPRIIIAGAPASGKGTQCEFIR